MLAQTRALWDQNAIVVTQKVGINSNRSVHRSGASYPYEKKLEVVLKYQELLDNGVKVTC